MVKDMLRSRRFYSELLGLQVISDFGANITFAGGISLLALDTWAEFIGKPSDQVVFGHNAGELYFETDCIEAFIQRLNGFLGAELDIVHPLIEHRWGQKVIRFYDPDGHIIEVGEDMELVVRRFIESGLTVEQTATRMGVKAEYVTSCLASSDARPGA